MGSMIPMLLNLALLPCDLLAARAARRDPRPPVFALGLMAGPLVALVVALLGHSFLGWTVFSVMQTEAWALFLHLPFLLGFMAFQARGRVLRILLGGAALLLLGIGVDAFLVEPRRLEVKRVRLPIADRPLVIALLADIQTDRVGRWETSVFETVREASPDLVLFAGDYVQTWTDEAFRAQVPRFRELVSSLEPRLGMIAVMGDVDPENWTLLFEGIGVEIVTESRAIDLGELVVTALAPWDSRSRRPPVAPRDRPHVVLGHAPDFADTLPPADLLLAGHVHGGQVRLPFLGPIFTLSRLPRAWTSGTRVLENGATLHVSRGIGLERMDAPRMRFLCRPELVIVELGPKRGI